MAAAAKKAATKTAPAKTASKPAAKPAPQPAAKPAATQEWAAAPAPAAQPAGFDVRQYNLFLHLSALATFIGIPGIVGPLVMWLIKKDVSPEVDAHGRAAVNFHLTMIIAYIVSAILIIVLIGFLLLAAVAIVSIVFAILNGVKASKGEPIHYPMSIQFIKPRQA